MALLQLPNELLEAIIKNIIPEGFESLAMTCKDLYRLCIPFIHRYNHFHSRFNHFRYCNSLIDQPPDPLYAAWDLLVCIAVEPCVARYIRTADLAYDSCSIDQPPFLRSELTDVVSQAMIRLFQGSPYFKQAGLDWREYYAETLTELEQEGYSQYAATFLLTLLPNIKDVTLPREWEQFPEPGKLINAVIYKANQKEPIHHMSSLAQVVSFGLDGSSVSHHNNSLDFAIPFLSLPRIQSFSGPNCVAIAANKYLDDYPDDEYWSEPRIKSAKSLKVANFSSCCVDEIGIVEFLQHATRLKSLSYSHTTKINYAPAPLIWDICTFVAAIMRILAKSLEELSISIHKLSGSLAPGRVSFRNFQRLRKLEFPLEILTLDTHIVTVPDGALSDRQITAHDTISLCDILPATLTHLSLLSWGWSYHAKALEGAFRGFAKKKAAMLPALKEIFLECPEDANAAYKEECTRLYTETEKAGVLLRLRPSISRSTPLWGGN